MSLRRNPDLVRRDGGSQQPMLGGGLYMATVLSASPNGRVSISIPVLGLKIPNVNAVGNTATNKLKKDDSVVVAFLENDVYNVVIVGRINTVDDIYPTKDEFNALAARVTALENQG